MEALEPDGVVTLTIEPDATKYTVGDPNSAEVAVTDDMTPTGISVVAISEATITEDGENNSEVNFQIKADSASSASADRIINISISDGDANFLHADDSAKTSVTIPQNKHSVNLPVTILGDTNFEPHGAVLVTILPSGGSSSTYNVAGTNSSASISVFDDDFPTADADDSIAIRALKTTVSEAEMAPFQIIAKTANNSAVRTIKVMVANKASGDFLPATTYDNPVDVDIAQGALFEILNVMLHDDDAVEDTGAITATVIADGSATPPYTLSSEITAEIAVTSEDVAVVLPVITVSGNSATEGGTPDNISFSLDKANGTDPVVITATVDAVRSSAKETTDYSLSEKMVTIASTEQNGMITVSVVNDDYNEASETFVLNLTATGATFTSGHDTLTYTITDNDAEPTVSIATGRFENESDADTAGMITVTLSQKSGQMVTVPYTITGTATDVTDYVITGATGNTGTVTFTPDSSTTITDLTQNIEYTIKGDNDPESEEQFTITLGTPTNADSTNQNTTSTITIIDDDSGPELNISVLPANAEVHEADNAKAIFTISANKEPVTNFEYRFEVTQEGDFLATTPSNPDTNSPTFSGSNNNYTASHELDISNDDVAEANGSITLTLLGANGSEYTLGSKVSEKVIVYDNDMPVLSIAGGAAVAEGSGAKATFTITSVVDVTERLRVLYRPDDGIGNFLIGDTAGNNQIAFLDFNGGKTATLTLDIADDEVAEEAGMVTVTLLADDASPINYSVVASGSTGAVAVSDNDTLATPPVVTLTTEPQPAGSTTATFYVTVPTTQTSDLEVVVEYNYRTSADGEPVTYLFEDWLKTVATIPAVQTYGSVTLNLTPPVQGASGGATGQADQVLQTRLASGASYTPSATEPIGVSGTSASQATPLVSIRSTVGNDILESDTLTFEVSASPSGTAISGVDVEVTQTGDFIDTGTHTLTGGTSYTESVDIPTAGSVTFNVALHDDDDGTESDGTITATVQVDDTKYTLGDQSKTAVVRVQDDDSLPTISIASPTTISEDAGPITFTLTAEGVSAATDLTVRYLIENGTGDDFIDVTTTTVNAPLQFTDVNGNFEDTITVALDDDSLDEADGEVSVTIQADPTPPYSYVVHATNFKGTAPVMDDDPEPELTIAVASGNEGTTVNGSVEFTPTLNAVSGRDVVVSYWTTLDTSGVGDPAEADDFTAVDSASPDTITIPAGSLTPLKSDRVTVDTISITTIADNVHEENETFILNFNGDFSGETAGATAKGTILNDDALPVVTVTGVNITEGGADADISFSLDKDAGAGGVSITALVDTDNSTATETTDYMLSSTTVSIAEGSRTGTITVTVVNDELDEADNEMFMLSLTATGATFSGGANTGSVSNTIVDNDDAPVISVASFAVADSSASTVNFEVTLVGETARDVSIAYVLDASGSTAATEGTDFNLGGASPLVITAGTKSGMIPISILADGVTGEGEETIVLNLTATNATFAGGATTSTETGIITDLPIVSIDTRFERVAETDYVRYTLTGTGITTDTTVNLRVAHNAGLVLTASSELSPRLTSANSTTTGLIRFIAEGTNNNELVEIEISPGGTSYSINPSMSQISFRVDAGTNFPAVSIVGDGPVSEGTNAAFTVSTDESDLTRTEELVVAVSVSESGTNFISGTLRLEDLEVRIPGGSTSASYTVSTTGDTNAGGNNGTITVSVEPGPDYKLAASGTSDSVTVRDDGGTFTLPEVSITSVAAGPTGTGVTERYSFKFNVETVNNVIGENLDVQITYPTASASTHGLTITGPSQLTINDGSRISNDGTVLVGASGAGLTNGATADLTFEIMAVAGKYTVGTGSIVVTVKDGNDGNENTPVMSITGENSVYEGESAAFTLASSHTPSNTSLQVAVRIENVTGDFLTAGNETRMIPYPGTNSGAFDVATIIDDPDGNAGEIKVTILEGNGYALPDTLGAMSATTDVVDPLLTIASQYSNVVPDSEMEFTVSVTPTSRASVNVPVTASDATNSSLTITPTPPLAIGSSGSITARVSTESDSSGNLTLTLGAVAGYTLGAPLVIPVESPTTPATLSIASSTTPVTEG